MSNKMSYEEVIEAATFIYNELESMKARYKFYTITDSDTYVTTCNKEKNLKEMKKKIRPYVLKLVKLCSKNIDIKFTTAPEISFRVTDGGIVFSIVKNSSFGISYDSEKYFVYMDGIFNNTIKISGLEL